MNSLIAAIVCALPESLFAGFRWYRRVRGGMWSEYVPRTLYERGENFRWRRVDHCPAKDVGFLTACYPNHCACETHSLCDRC